MIRTFSKSDIKKLEDTFIMKYGQAIITVKDLVQITDDKIMLVNKEPSFFLHDKQWAPTLKLILKKPFLKTVTVDMGAVKFVANGADIMRPGIVETDAGISAGDFIVVQDVNNKKPLAVGVALFSSSEIDSYKKGRVVKTIHYVGDDIWKFSP